MPKTPHGRFPGYDVLAKWDTPSWNDATRRVIARRLAIGNEPRFFTQDHWATLTAVCARIVPQPPDREPIPVAALLDDKLRSGHREGYRHAQLPQAGEAWRRGLGALDAEAGRAHGQRFSQLEPAQQDALLKQAESGELKHDAWGGMPPQLFFKARLLHDIVSVYYAHPTAWSEMGFGGPASPRGYVRMGFDRRDPWEAAEAKGDDPSDRERTRRINERVG